MIVEAKRRGLLFDTIWRGTLSRLSLMLLVSLMATRTAADVLPEVISGGSDRAIKHWDKSGKLTATVGTQDDTIYALAFVPGESDKLAAVSADGALKLWDVAAKQMIWSVDAHSGGAYAVAISPNGRLIATGGADRHIRIWDRSNGKRLADMDVHSDAVRALQFASDGKVLVSGGADRTLRIGAVRVDAGVGVVLEYHSNIFAHDGTITALDISHDNRAIASVSEDGYLKTWRLDSGSLNNRIRVSGRAVRAVAYSPDSSLIATGDEDGKIRLWNAATGMALPFTGAHDRSVYALAWSPDGKTLISGGADKALRFWNVTKAQQIAIITAHDGTVRAVAVVP